MTEPTDNAEPSAASDGSPFTALDEAMTEQCKKTETSAAVWAAIRDAHKADLRVFGSFSDPDGFYGRPQMYTAWGFNGMDYPLIEMKTRWDRGDNGERLNEQTRYWLLSPIKENDV